jgi:hypothetical protein
MALIITPTTRAMRHAREDLLEQRRWRAGEEALGGGGAVGAADVKVVHSGERGELAIAEAMTAAVMEGWKRSAHSPATCSIRARALVSNA